MHQITLEWTHPFHSKHDSVGLALAVCGSRCAQFKFEKCQFQWEIIFSSLFFRLVLMHCSTRTKWSTELLNCPSINWCTENSTFFFSELSLIRYFSCKFSNRKCRHTYSRIEEGSLHTSNCIAISVTSVQAMPSIDLSPAASERMPIEAAAIIFWLLYDKITILMFCDTIDNMHSHLLRMRGKYEGSKKKRTWPSTHEVRATKSVHWAPSSNNWMFSVHFFCFLRSVRHWYAPNIKRSDNGSTT